MTLPSGLASRARCGLACLPHLTALFWVFLVCAPPWLSAGPAHHVHRGCGVAIPTPLLDTGLVPTELGLADPAQSPSPLSVTAGGQAMDVSFVTAGSRVSHIATMAGVTAPALPLLLSTVRVLLSPWER